MVGRSLGIRVLIIESDDWGSIRMPSKRAYENLQRAGVNLGRGESERYNKFDTLASSEDMEELLNTLLKVKNAQGEHPKLTAVSLVGNPDFQRIEQSEFKEYYWELLPKTFERYNNSAALDLWKKGREENLFYPEFHGREHLNVAPWMRALVYRDSDTYLSFKEGLWGFKRKSGEVNFQAAFDLELAGDLPKQQAILEEGLTAFEALHGYKARFFVPPNGPFNNALQTTAFKNGVKYLSTAKIQSEPLGDGKYRRRFHYLGKRSSSGLTYLTRNAFFEPSAGGKDWVASCLGEIEGAFRWHKPAVISTHRVNYIGVHNVQNRDNGLTQLKALLSIVVNKWPDVRFLTSTELGDLLTKG